MVVIALLTTGVAVGALKMLRDAEDERAKTTEDQQAKTDAAALAAATEAFTIGHRSQECPTPEQLKRDGFLSSRSKSEDPWGTPYRILCEPDSATAHSAGRDRIFETADDVKPDEP